MIRITRIFVPGRGVQVKICTVRPGDPTPEGVWYLGLGEYEELRRVVAATPMPPPEEASQEKKT